jgi:hypothetical protein
MKTIAHEKHKDRDRQKKKAAPTQKKRSQVTV